MKSKDDFSRQQFLGEDSEQILRDTIVTIIGLGGGGSHIAQQLAHLGVGHIRLIDPQAIDASNLNRLVGATTQDVKDETPKVEIAKRQIKGIRPWIDVEVAQSEWQAAISLIKDSHVLFGCVDGYMQRSYLEVASRRYCLPYIDIGMDVTKLGEQHYAVAGQMIVSLPERPCMRCLGFLTQQRLDKEENEYGDAGINPQVVWTNGMLASLAVGAFVRMVCPWSPIKYDYEWLELDGNNQNVTPSKQPNYMPKRPCTHYNDSDVGDPFFKWQVL